MPPTEQIDPVFLERLTRFEADELSGDELAAFESELRRDPAKRAALIDRFELGQRLRSNFRQQECGERIVRFTPAYSTGKTKTRRPRHTPVALAAAAAVILLGTIWFLLPHHPAAPSESPTAPPRLVFVQGASWGGNTPVTLGSEMRNGPWRLESGIVRLEFADGTQATIEGPATFNATNDKVIELSQGQLTASNEKGKGLSVVTNGRHIQTDGTSLGVQTHRGQDAEVCVFRGEVEIGRDQQAPVVLSAGSISSIGGESGGRIMSASQRLPFQRNLVVTCGIIDMDRTVLLFPSDIEHQLMEKEADGKAFLLPERRVRISTPISVSQVGVGSLSGRLLETRQTWHSNDPVRSFLLHASPSTRIETQGSQSFIGSVTFEHPIKAVIVSSSLLNQSERLFSGSISSAPETGRGLEVNHIWEEKARGHAVSDMIAVSNDRKTLTFNLLVGQKADQIRILTAGK